MTIRENILYGEEMDQGHYYDTIKLCELERDFEILPAGDLTEIGERGINLSGGQKARIGLARAVYSRKDIYLMDDPISALDAEVRKNIFKNVIFGHLKDKTCVLVTHAIDFLSYAHKVVVMEKGRIITQGTYDEVKEHKVVKKLLEVNDLNKNKVTEKKMKLNKEGSMVECEASD
jgi:ABC-type multidrug transport system fused ATPase/permease subunit